MLNQNIQSNVLCLTLSLSDFHSTNKNPLFPVLTIDESLNSSRKILQPINTIDKQIHIRVSPQEKEKLN